MESQHTRDPPQPESKNKLVHVDLFYRCRCFSESISNENKLFERTSEHPYPYPQLQRNSIADSFVRWARDYQLLGIAFIVA